MKFNSKFLLTCLVLVLLAGNSCRKDVVDFKQNAYHDTSEALDREDNPGVGLTTLGAKLGNPYAKTIVQQAYQNLYQTTISTLLPTHLYVRFLPTTPQQFGLLDIKSREYWDFPLDYKITHMGDHYHDPSIVDTTYTWLYTVVPYGYQFPAVTYEVLEQLVYVPDETQLMKEAYRLTSNTWSEPNAYLAAPTFHDGVLEWPTPPGPGGGGGDHGDGDGNGTGGGGIPPSTECGCPLPPNVRNPSGCVTVFDTQHSAYEGVRHIKVITAKDDLGYFFVNTTETNDKGCFMIDHQYHNKIHLWIRFKSDYCDIKTMKNSSDFYGYAYTRKGYKGTFGGPYFNNLAIKLNTNGNPANADHLNWKAATVNNAVHEYEDWCFSNGVTAPHDNLQILITPFGNTGATVMLDKMPLFTTTLTILGGNVLGGMFGWYGIGIAPLADWLGVFAPDIILNYSKPSEPSDFIKEVAYHECGHASHWELVGASYWQANMLYVASVILQESNNQPYGSGTLSGWERCAIIESWGFHVGETVADEHYGQMSSDSFIFQRHYFDPSTVPLRSSFLNAIEEFDPADNNDPWRWIPIGLYHDLIDDALENSPRRGSCKWRVL